MGVLFGRTNIAYTFLAYTFKAMTCDDSLPQRLGLLDRTKVGFTIGKVHMLHALRACEGT